tara:strand:+ start:488 stop:664 length:177 start_codon:yes stop_codon:yes gene_type:complete
MLGSELHIDLMYRGERFALRRRRVLVHKKNPGGSITEFATINKGGRRIDRLIEGNMVS